MYSLMLLQNVKVYSLSGIGLKGLVITIQTKANPQNISVEGAYLSSSYQSLKFESNAQPTEMLRILSFGHLT